MIARVYHEFISAGGDEGMGLLKELNESSYRVVQNRLIKGGTLEIVEDQDTLAEITDTQRCISIGLQSQKVFHAIYGIYTEASQRRNELISKKIDETLKPDEIGMVLLSERHQVRFPTDIQLFYVAPPALDEINRWMRDREAAAQKEEEEPDKSNDTPQSADKT